MTRGKLLRTLGLTLGVIVILAAVGVVGYSMQHSTSPVHASGTGGGGPCFVSSGGAPVCQFRGFNASAYYSTVDTTTCPNGVYTTYSVYTANNVEINGSSSPTGGPLVAIFFWQWNECTWSGVSYYGETTAATIKYTGNLQFATAQATIKLQDWNYNPGPTVTVNLNWTGIGDVSAYMDSSSNRTGNIIYKSHFTGENRMSQVSGTISDGTSTYPITTTSVMFEAKSGTILFQHA